MNPGVHLAVAWWTPGFISFSAGLTFMIKLNARRAVGAGLVVGTAAGERQARPGVRRSGVRRSGVRRSAIWLFSH